MSNSNNKQASRFSLNEDWLALIIAFVVILLSIIGLLGPNGLKIVF